MKKHSFYSLIIALVALVALWKSFGLYFVADDFVFMKSARDLSFLDLLDVKTTLAYQGFPVFLYERFFPLFLLFKLDYALWGQNAFGYHLTAFVLHLLCCLGTYAFAWVLTRDREASFLGGLFFASHYAHVGGIAFIANRQAPTACVLYLLSTICYILYVQTDRQRLYYWLAFLGFVGAVWSYEIGLTLPVLFFMYELLFSRLPLKRLLRESLLRYLPFAIGGGFYLAVYLSLQVEKQHVRFSVSKLIYPIRYTIDLLVPFASGQFEGYSLLRSFLKSQLEAGSYLIIGVIGLVLLGVLAGVGAIFLKSSRVVKFLVSWVYISLLLAFIAPYYAESLIYTPSVGFCIGLALGIKTLFQSSVFGRPAIRRAVKIAVVVGIVIVYTIITSSRIAWWGVGGARTKRILSGIQEAVPKIPAESCVFLVDPPDNYRYVVPTFLNDEDLTAALQLVYDEPTILADRIFLRRGKPLETDSIDISFGTRQCVPERCFVFQYLNDDEGIQQLFNVCEASPQE